jgi:hypothetical protein
VAFVILPSAALCSTGSWRRVVEGGASALGPRRSPHGTSRLARWSFHGRRLVILVYPISPNLGVAGGFGFSQTRGLPSNSATEGKAASYALD